MSTPVPRTFVDLLRDRAESQPSRRVFTFLRDGESESGHLTFQDLDERARAIAVALRSVAKQGDAVLLLYPPGLDYIATFFGCLYAGLLAVPVYPPHRAQVQRFSSRLRAIAADSRATVVLTRSELLPVREALTGSAPELASLPWLDSGATDTAAATWRRPELGDTTAAYIQYTSGSTAKPKGVVLTHAQLLSNCEVICRCFGVDASSVGVLWLPPYHDMGLIGGILEPVYVGLSVVLMSPVAFLQRPRRWLKAISRYRAQVSGGPNFSYELCLRRVPPEERVGLDLSSWEVAFNGAEPVRSDTLDRFSEGFAPVGFRRRAFLPCYGLAEATLMVSGGPKQTSPLVRAVDTEMLALGRFHEAPTHAGNLASRASRLVACGAIAPEHRVVIVDPATRVPKGRGEIGEIWVSGPSVANGYWRRAENTEEIFRARLANTDEGPFLRTGDLGCVDGEQLFITGRLKGLLVIRGRNHYPQDIEWTVERSHPALRPGCGAAFAVERDGEERLIVVQEIERRAEGADLEALRRVVRDAIAEEHGLDVHELVLLRAGTIPKTSSGKIQRQATRTAFLEGRLERVDLASASGEAQSPSSRRTQARPTEALLESLRSLVARTLDVSPAAVMGDASLGSLAFNSLTIVELQQAIEKELGRHVSLEDLTLGVRLQELAVWLDRPANEIAPAAAWSPTTDRDQRHEPFPLTDVQEAYWVGRQQGFDLGGVATHFYAEYDCSRLDVRRLENAWHRLISRHDMLRAVVRPDGRQQVLSDVPHYWIEEADLSDASAETLERRLLDVRARLSHVTRTGAEWPLFGLEVTQLPAGRSRLHVEADLLTTDAWSWKILGRELFRVYEQLETVLPPFEVSFRDVVIAERALRQEQAYEQSLRYWRAKLHDLPGGPELPLAKPPAEVGVPCFRRHVRSLDAGAWSRLKRTASQPGLTPSSLLLAAFAEVLAYWSKNRHFTLNVTFSDRPTWHAQIPQLVGDFTSILLLDLDLTRPEAFASRALAAQQRLFAALEHRSVSGVRLLRERSRQRERAPAPIPVVFTSLLLIGGEETEAGELGELVYAVSQTPQVWLDHQVSERHGALHLSWDAMEGLFPEDLLDDMLDAYVGLLQRLAQNEATWHEALIVLLPEAQRAQRAQVNLLG